MKAGYPPHDLVLIPELPLESLGLKQGEQLIVRQKAEANRTSPGSALRAQSPPSSTVQSSRGPTTGLTASQVREPSPSRGSPAANAGGPDYVETDGGYLVHRVRSTDAFRTLHLMSAVCLADRPRRQFVLILVRRAGIRARHREGPEHPEK